MQYPTNARVIRAMCSGRFSTKFAQKAFEMGAGAVLYSGCHLPSDCHFQTGNHWMAKREPRIRSWMKRNNIDDNRFRVEWVSAGEGKKWQTIMTEMANVVEESKGKDVPVKIAKKTKAPSKSRSVKTSKPRKKSSGSPDTAKRVKKKKKASSTRGKE